MRPQEQTIIIVHRLNIVVWCVIMLRTAVHIYGTASFQRKQVENLPPIWNTNLNWTYTNVLPICCNYLFSLLEAIIWIIFKSSCFFLTGNIVPPLQKRNAECCRRKGYMFIMKTKRHQQINCVSKTPITGTHVTSVIQIITTGFWNVNCNLRTVCCSYLRLHALVLQEAIGV